jgi:hypothetical protein
MLTDFPSCKAKSILVLNQVILGNLHKMSLSKLLIISGLITLIFDQSQNIGLLAVIIGFVLYFRAF